MTDAADAPPLLPPPFTLPGLTQEQTCYHLGTLHLQNELATCRASNQQLKDSEAAFLRYASALNNAAARVQCAFLVEAIMWGSLMRLHTPTLGAGTAELHVAKNLMDKLCGLSLSTGTTSHLTKANLTVVHELWAKTKLMLQSYEDEHFWMQLAICAVPNLSGRKLKQLASPETRGTWVRLSLGDRHERWRTLMRDATSAPQLKAMAIGQRTHARCTA